MINLLFVVSVLLQCRGKVESTACGQREKRDKYIDALLHSGMHLLTRIQANQLYPPLCACVFAPVKWEWVLICLMGLRCTFASDCVRICSEQLYMGRLPGISLTVVLPGYNVFKQLSSCHPGRGKGREEWQEEGKEERKGRKKDRQIATGKQKREVVSIHKRNAVTHMSKMSLCVCVYRIYSQVKDEVMKAFLWNAVMESHCKREGGQWGGDTKTGVR